MRSRSWHAVESCLCEASSSGRSMSSSTALKMKICWIALLASHGRPACEKLMPSRSFVTGDESTLQRNGPDAKASPHDKSCSRHQCLCGKLLDPQPREPNSTCDSIVAG